jgi:hypothetical protein
VDGTGEKEQGWRLRGRGVFEVVAGKIAFDTEHTSGVLVYRPWWVEPAGG